MLSEDQLWAGIDIGKAAHHICVIDTAGRRVWSKRITNDQPSLETAIDAITSLNRPVRWAVDLVNEMSSLLLAALAAREHTVVYVTGSMVHAMSRTFSGEGKTDARDARVIAELCRIRPELTPIRMHDALITELTHLTSYRADLQDDWVRGINRLRALLTGIFPTLEAAFDYSNRSSLILVAALCTPTELRHAGPEGIATVLTDHNIRRQLIEAISHKAYQLACDQNITIPGENPIAELIKRHARRLLDLDREITHTEKTIATRFRTHPQADIIESMPGIGPGLGADLLVNIHGDFSHFATAGKLASFAGLVPVPRDSGRISGNLRRPRRYNRKVRRVFYLAAMTNIKKDGPSRTYYLRKRDEHLIHTQATLALARRLVDVLWAMLRDNTHYQPPHTTTPTPTTA